MEEKPWTFTAVIPGGELIRVGGELARGSFSLQTIEDLNGVAGCTAKFLRENGIDFAQNQVAMSTAESLSLEQIGEELKRAGEQFEAAFAAPNGDIQAAFNWALLFPLIMQAIKLLLSRIGNGGGATPGPIQV